MACHSAFGSVLEQWAGPGLEAPGEPGCSDAGLGAVHKRHFMVDKGGPPPGVPRASPVDVGAGRPLTHGMDVTSEAQGGSDSKSPFPPDIGSIADSLGGAFVNCRSQNWGQAEIPTHHHRWLTDTPPVLPLACFIRVCSPFSIG